MIVHKLSFGLNDNGYNFPSGSISETGSAEVAIDASIPAGSTSLARSTSITAANVQAVWMVASTDLVIKTNSTSSPANTINLKAGVPLLWSKSAGYFSAPFSADVTSFYFTNSTVPTAFQARILTS